ncbi:MAG: hypothetical protein GXO47_08905 [Chlorobi bacterium]|nr:hypothetical protein [Chlorobiota bacterium]
MKTKKYYLSLAFMFTIIISAFPQSNDTIICIIDTTSDLISKIEKSYQYKEMHPSYKIDIKANFPENKNKAKFHILSFREGGAGFPDVKLMKKGNLVKYPKYSEKWLYNQNHEDSIKNVFQNQNIILMVFQNDWEDIKNDSIQTHNVTLWWNHKLPFSKDTVVLVVDTSSASVSYKNFYFDNKGNFRGVICLKGNYYNKKLHENKNFPGICVGTFENSQERELNKTSKISIPASMVSNYDIVDIEWISKQTDLHKIKKRLGYTPWSKNNFIIFKNDLCNTCRYVNLYRVTVSYAEITE